MIVWKGWGWVVPFVVGAVFLATEVGVERMAQDADYYQDHRWPKLLGCDLSAGAVWLLSKALDAREARVLIDPEPGEERPTRRTDSFYFIPVRSWPFALLALSLAFVFAK